MPWRGNATRWKRGGRIFANAGTENQPTRIFKIVSEWAGKV
jgi:hypothetical protein